MGSPYFGKLPYRDGGKEKRKLIVGMMVLSLGFRGLHIGKIEKGN